MPLSLIGNLGGKAGGVGAGRIGPDVEELTGQLAGDGCFIHPRICAFQQGYNRQIAKSGKESKGARVHQSWKHSCSNQSSFPGSSTDQTLLMISKRMSQAGPPRTPEGEAAKGKEGEGRGGRPTWLGIQTPSSSGAHHPGVSALDFSFLGQELINTNKVSKEHFWKGRVILSPRSIIVKFGGTSGKGPACHCRRCETRVRSLG